MPAGLHAAPRRHIFVQFIDLSDCRLSYGGTIAIIKAANKNIEKPEDSKGQL